MIVEPPEAPVSKEFCKSRDVTVSDNRDGNELVKEFWDPILLWPSIQLHN